MRLHKLFTLAAMVALFVAAGTVYAAGGVSNPFHSIVDTDFVKQHVTVPMSEDVMVIDSRPKRAKYDKGHIPMSVSIPDSAFDKHVDLLPKNKDALLVFYCGGLKCPLSHKSAFKAEALGYKNVKVYAAGYPAWVKAGNYGDVDVDWIQNQVAGGADMVLVDSRPARKKYDKGHIPSAINIPSTQWDKFKDRLPAEKEKLVVFYCGGYKCKLSHKGAEAAKAMGYTNVMVFSGGYPAWKAKYAGAGTAIKSGGEEGSIEIAQFESLLTGKSEAIMIVDVRDADEYAAGHFPSAVNIPVDKLEAKIASLPADKPVVFVCSTGARSGESYYMVQDVRPELKNVYYLEAEVTFHKDGTYKIVKPAA